MSKNNSSHSLIGITSAYDKRVALKNDHSTKDEFCRDKRQKKVNKYKAGGMLMTFYL
jgi:hypothetical protein